MNAYPRGAQIHFPNHLPVYTVIDLLTEDFKENYEAVMTLLIHIFGPASPHTTGVVGGKALVEALDKKGYDDIAVCKQSGIALALCSQLGDCAVTNAAGRA